jgi:hypothetical protein
LQRRLVETGAPAHLQPVRGAARRLLIVWLEGALLRGWNRQKSAPVL